MASIIALAGGALINALAFSGSNFLFSKLSDHGEEERKRHDLAIEGLQKARDKWVEERQKRLDFINQRLQEKRAAKAYINNLDEGMRIYYEATKQHLPPLEKEPVLSDFYHPSESQKTAELIFISGSLASLGYLCYKFL